MKTLIQAVAMVLFASSTAQGQQAVQWRVQDGGNGHWYSIDPTPRLWGTSRAFATAIGGELASFETPGEAAWCQANAGFNGNVNLGGQQDAGSGSPSAGWRWLNGSAVTLSWFAFGFDDSPCSLSPGENGAQDYLHSSGSYLALGDVNADPFPGCDHNLHLHATLVEWSADCNTDGIVDYGQILQGQLPDTNTNGIPDGCECSTFPTLPACCAGDLNQDRFVDGADLGILLNAWGTCSGACPADLNRDGFVDGSDLGTLLGRWGGCP